MHRLRCNPSSVTGGYFDSNVGKNNIQEHGGLFPTVLKDRHLQGGGQNKDTAMHGGCFGACVGGRGEFVCMRAPAFLRYRLTGFQ